MTSRNNISQLPDLAPLGIYNACSGALSLAVPQESINLIIAPSFELYTNATLAQLTCWKVVTNAGTSNADAWVSTGTYAWSGASSLYSRAVGGNNVQTIRYETLSVIAGQQYAWSFYVRGAPNCRNRQYTTVIRDASTSTAYASKTFNITESSWQRVELVWHNAAATSVVVTIEKSLESGSYAGGDCYIDACQFERIIQYDSIVGGVFAVGASTYFDGDTVGFYNRTATKPEYAWTGFPHRATSSRSATTTHGGRLYNLQDECGFNVIAINEAGINAPNNQVVDFNTADGSALIDIVNPKRTITIVGRISGADKNDFAMKMSKFIALFSRDVSALRLPRRYVFQHKNVRADVGVPMTFFAIFAGGLNVQMSSEYSADTELSLTMVDPYFYGHDESVDLTVKRLAYPTLASNPRVFTLPANVSDMFNDATPTTNYFYQALGQNKSAVFNGAVNCITFEPNTGLVWIGGAFTAISGVTYNRIVKYDIQTKTFLPVLSASGALNGIESGFVNCIEFAPNGDAWIGGQFARANVGVAFSSGLTYYRSSQFFGFAGEFNQGITPLATINAISIRTIENLPPTLDYTVVVGGVFTQWNTGASLVLCANIAQRSTPLNTWVAVTPISGGSQGVNNTVTQIVYDRYSDVWYFAGSFTNSAGSTYPITGVGALQLGIYQRVLPVAAPSGARQLFLDDDGSLLIGNGASIDSSYILANSALRVFPYDVTRRPRRLRNGIYGIFGVSDNVQGVPYWNGTLLSGTGVVYLPASSPPFLFADFLEMPDGTILFSTNDAFNVAQLVKGYNSSTAAAKPTFQNYFGTSASVYQHVNMINQKMLIFQGLLTAPRPQLFAKYELITINTKAVSSTSTFSGNNISIVYAASQLTTFTIEPGNVILSSNDITQTLTSSASAPVNIGVCYWSQTFQSIFDGVSRT